MMFGKSTDTVQLDLHEMKSLIVEDHDFTRHLLIEALRALGTGEMVTARHGKEAIALLHNFTPDLVITDCWMTPIGGIALARFLRGDPASPSPFVPIVMVTTDTRASCARRARDAGVNELLIKPFSPRALHDRISRAVLSSRRFVTAGRYFGPDRRRMDAVIGRGANERRDGATMADFFPGTFVDLGAAVARVPIPT